MEHIDFPKVTTKVREMKEAVEALSNFLPDPHSAAEMLEFTVLELFKLGFLVEKEKHSPYVQLVNKLNSWVGEMNGLLRGSDDTPVPKQWVTNFVAAANAALHLVNGKAKHRKALEAWLAALQGRVPADFSTALKNARKQGPGKRL